MIRITILLALLFIALLTGCSKDQSPPSEGEGVEVPVAEGDVPDSASDATPTFEEYEAMREAWLAACMSIDAVIVADQESRRRLLGECLPDLLSGPSG